MPLQKLDEVERLEWIEWIEWIERPIKWKPELFEEKYIALSRHGGGKGTGL
jgi:hypothetical protein